MEMLVGLAVMLMVPGYVVAQAMMLARYRGRWRLAAAVPLALLLPAVVWSAVAYGAGANLWPLPVLLVAPLGCVVLAVVSYARWVGGGSSR